MAFFLPMPARKAAVEAQLAPAETRKAAGEWLSGRSVTRVATIKSRQDPLQSTPPHYRIPLVSMSPDTGYSDHQDGSISFTFYDQGQGIASTLREKMDKRIVHRLRGWSDANWLERAIRKPISRHESARRGHGLNKLKMFIDRIGHQGSLRVLANTGDVQFTGKGVTSVKVGAQELSGSLIVWTLCPSNRLPVVEHEQ